MEYWETQQMSALPHDLLTSFKPYFEDRRKVEF